MDSRYYIHNTVFGSRPSRFAADFKMASERSGAFSYAKRRRDVIELTLFDVGTIMFGLSVATDHISICLGLFGIDMYW